MFVAIYVYLLLFIGRMWADWNVTWKTRPSIFCRSCLHKPVDNLFKCCLTVDFFGKESGQIFQYNDLNKWTASSTTQKYHRAPLNAGPVSSNYQVVDWRHYTNMDRLASMSAMKRKTLGVATLQSPTKDCTTVSWLWFILLICLFLQG